MPRRSLECRLCCPNQPPQSLAQRRRWRGSRADSPLRSSPEQARTTAPARRTARSLSHLALLAFARRVSDDNASRFYVLHRNCSCTNNCSLANCHAPAYEPLPPNPPPPADHHPPPPQRTNPPPIIPPSRPSTHATPTPHT